MPAEDKIKRHIKKRQQYFEKLQYCFNCIQGGEAKKREFLVKVLTPGVDEIVEKHESLIDEVNDLNNDLPETVKPTDTSQWQKTFDDIYYQIKAHELALLEQDRPPPSPASASTSGANETKVKLPVLSIPCFEGDPSNFQTWLGLFDQLIHRNAQISEIEKFSYLKSFLKGPALACIEHVPFVGSSYPLAYHTLKERFLRKRIIAGSHLSKVLQFSPLKHESLAGLRSFLDIVNVSVESLKGLTLAKLDEFILVYLGLNLLDSTTRKLFETEYKDTEFPSFKQLVTFIKDRCSVLEMTSNQGVIDLNKSSFKKSSFVSVQSNPIVQKPSTSAFPNEPKPNKQPFPKCTLCHQQPFHKIAWCPKFLKAEPSKRYSIIKEHQLCFSCFSAHHPSSLCTSTFTCRQCNSSQHHTLLHPADNKKPTAPIETTGSNPGSHRAQKLVSNIGTAGSTPDGGVTSKVVSGVAQASHSVLLGTATVQIQDSIGQWHNVRCIIDPGSQISAVSEALVQTLGLPRKRCTLEISGIGSQSSIRAKGEVNCAILPHPKVCSSEIQPLHVCAAVLPKIASDIPSSVPIEVLDKFRHLQLADNNYLSHSDSVSDSLDLLLGAEYYADVLVSTFPVIPGSPSAVPSYFGWLLMGKVCDVSSSIPSKATSLFISSLHDPLSDQIQKFWKLEDISEVKPVDPNDVLCESHFLETHSRDPATGKYIVRLPFTDNKPPELPSNRAIAIKRFQNLQIKLDKNPHMKSLYSENLKSYIDQGHMAVAENHSPFLLVHHAVYKQSSSTPVRVVFDPNVSVGKNPSLSNVLLTGENLQANIGDLLVKFRLNLVALLCDIKAMYRCIWLHDDDCKYQHLLWQGEHGKMIEYELKTVTFGLPPSSFLAQRVVKQLVSDEGHNFPMAGNVVANSVYVDDVVTGSDSIQSACALKQELIDLMRKGGFELRKWASSHNQVLADLPAEMCETVHSLGDTDSLKVLGAQWSPTSDSFFYSVKPSETSNLTKRKILSVIASTYDPNGFLSPVTVWLKIFMQQVWLNKDISWDTVLPKPLQEKWILFMSEIQLLEDILIPRYILSNDLQSIELVGFADGSSVAYSAVVYLRTVNSEGFVRTHLIRAKTKVSPLKVLPINKIELCGALLLARVIKSLSFLTKQLNISNIYLFSDSTTVLSWLTIQPHLLKTFIANRVVEIHELTNCVSWRHVSSQENSADPASRGIFPSELVNNSLWFEGPSFLKKDPQEWPQGPVQAGDIPEMKTKRVHVNLTTQVEDDNIILSLIKRYSSLGKLQRILAYVLRFLHNTKFPNDKRSGFLTVSELQQALNVSLKTTQRFHFRDELAAIKRGEQCSSFLRSLSPMINSCGLLVVGGRLKHAPLSEGAKHPVLVPKKSPLAILLVNYYHILTIHGGPLLVQSLLLRHFWIIGARSLIRSVLHKCVSCVRFMAKPAQPYMADLPPSRFEQGRPFINVGVDFGGPFPFKTGPRRNSPIDKCWLALFVCLSTKAVHLEVVSSLSSDAFLATLDRFIARRSLPSKIVCDNATNFRGASVQLQEIHNAIVSSESEIVRHLQPRCIQWQFSPPGAPNFNALAEAGIKSVKNHLRHVIGEQPLNLEQYASLFASCEAILNSRPLYSLPAGPNEGTDYLSPGHFLVGAPLLSRPEPEVKDLVFTPAKRWKLITHFSQCFWKRWSREYLNSLQQRSKWTKKCPNVQVGDVVLIQSPNMGPQNWPIAKVIELLPGRDDQIRVVKVKTPRGDLVRPVTKLVVLPTTD
ncbi:hypothetical protein M8J77_000362 [Diaphorina citri]|nr:hypothetical protein M8J77_000362 [Diaphorina citri]